MVDARANRRASEIIAGEEETGRAGAQILQSRRHALMADVVLRQGAWPTRYVLCDRGAADAEDGGELGVRDGGDSLRAIGSDLGISHSTQKAREAGHALGSASGEERRIPDGSQ